MTRPPSYHYAAADALLAELAETKPESFKFPFVQAKVQRAQIHALLANSPWHPGLEAEEILDSSSRNDEPSAIQTRTAKGDYL
ncbi:hypothetical protein CM06_gp49 [Mycobacterium phage Babsiella]|uniref:Uncharacterized protein n=2 Tax=Caudoviricetes TaxID=2731619 RepID=G8I6T2_9CAUD|nr:hypothetical protein CM06_gp49 [Mycobacterium phage Babsiella]YP_009964457.1 hypothetical protein I5J41_gp46 [Mycobacterium phage Jung]AER48426.1 hypothetical protein BABSIELLA_49 [Mycobacterium phage Babsiella]QKY80206.1 hypothetical protein SEA_JUNG_46 [Mycobacterium phage Jung]